MNSSVVPSLLLDGWLGPFEQKSRWLPQGNKYLQVPSVLPAVCCLTCVGFHQLQCFSEVQKAFAALEAAIKFGNLSQVAVDFNCCDVLKDPNDQVARMSLEGCLSCSNFCQTPCICTLFGNLMSLSLRLGGLLHGK